MNNARDSSQKSGLAMEVARAPKRQRGRARVEALLTAAAGLFAEKGYQATTMTEIAAAAGASIGSLYQFFPSKPVLAEALLQGYLQQLHQALDRIEAELDGLDAAALAAALLALMLGLLRDRNLALLMLEAVDDAVSLRQQWRMELRQRLADLLRGWRLAAPRAEWMPVAIVVLQLMKAAPVLAEEFGSDSGESRALREALASYLGQIAQQET